MTSEEATRLRRLYPGTEPVGATNPDLEGRLPIARSHDGACIFLDNDGCNIHKLHGADAKPAACRHFPYSLSAAGGDNWLHLSRMCPTVYDESGARGEKLQQDVLASGVEPRTMRGTEPVRIAGTCSLSWQDYLRLEESLCSLLEDDRWPLDEAVAGGMMLIDNIVTGVVTGVPSKQNDPQMELVLDGIARRNPIIGVYRFVMAGIVTAIESERGEAMNFSARRANIGRFLRLLFRSGAMRLDSIACEVPLRKVPAIPWPRRDHPKLTPLRRFLTSHIRHKFLLKAQDVEFSYRLLIAAYAAVKFYARAVAASRNRDTLHGDDLRRGVEVAELHLLLHRRGGTIERDLSRGLVRKLLFHPSFPSSMVAF